MVPVMGIKGAAIALLLGELVTLVCYVYSARQWLAIALMQWPKPAFLIASLSLVVAAAGMTSIVIFTNYDHICLVFALVTQAFIINKYWAHLPFVARQQAAIKLARLLPWSSRGALKKSASNAD